jgi:uncharacterized tellurite resistance protein B-like protein
MALKQEVKDALKNTYGLDVDKLIDAVKAEAEVDYELPKEQTVIKNADLVTRDQNKIDEGKKEGEKSGEIKGRELAAKAFKKKFALEDSVPNDPDKVVEAVNAKLNKGDAALQEQVQALLKDKETLANEKAQLQARAEQAAFDAELISMFPANRSVDLKDAERLALLKMDLTIEKADGKVVVKRNGQILQDPNTHAPLPLNKVIPDYFTERKWVGKDPNGGRGGGDNPPGGGGAGIKKASEFKTKWIAENPGKNEVSPEYMNALSAHAKDLPDFDWHN